MTATDAHRDVSGPVPTAERQPTAGIVAWTGSAKDFFVVGGWVAFGGLRTPVPAAGTD
jgi:hypothetical protein